MDNFEIISLRLKQVLKMKTDKQVAELLGFTQRAWVGRKKSGKFPEKELFMLKSLRPDLNLDVEFILNGSGEMRYTGAMTGYQSTHEILTTLWKKLGLSDDLFDAMLWAHREKNPNWEGFLNAALAMEGLLNKKPIP